MKRRSFLINSLAGGTLLAGRVYAQSGSWPNQAVRIIVPFPPGGTPDIAARVLAQNFGAHLKQPIIVENRVGAAGTIGVTAAAQSKDSHTLLLATTAIINAPHMSSVRYDVSRDFDAIGMISLFPNVLVVAANSKYQSVKEILADASARPGEVVCGNGGTGTTSYLACETLMHLAGVNLLQVPYKGEGALTPDILSNTVSMAIASLPTVLPHIRSGRLRALAVAAMEPHSDLPGISTFAALGVPNLIVHGWVVLLAAKGIPLDRLTDLELMLEKALTNESVSKTLTGVGLIPVISGRIKTEEFMQTESQRWGQLIRVRNIKTD